MKPEIAIIGYGRFGKLAAGYLKKHGEIYAADKKPISTGHVGVHVVSLEEAAAKSHVILAVPINQMEQTIRQISPFLKSGTVVYDVCSVKERPVQWMKKYLPSSISIVGTHPLFGPDSAGHSLDGRSIAICPVRVSKNRLNKIKNFLRRLHLDVKVMKPDQHDRLMASTLFLTQFIGRGLAHFLEPGNPPLTQNYILLKQIIDASNHDSNELFRDMFKYNRFTRRLPQKIIRDFKNLADSLKK